MLCVPAHKLSLHRDPVGPEGPGTLQTHGPSSRRLSAPLGGTALGETRMDLECPQLTGMFESVTSHHPKGLSAPSECGAASITYWLEEREVDVRVKCWPLGVSFRVKDTRLQCIYREFCPEVRGVRSPLLLKEVRMYLIESQLH